MARPIKEGMDYFPHDTDAVNDEKIEALRALYGNDGYAFYFILLERIYRANDAEIDVSDAEIIQILSKKVAVTPEKFMQILETALKWGCFDREEYEKRGVLTSNGIKKRAAVVLEKRASMREKYRKQRGSGVSASETGEETRKERDKVKKRKVKESKEKKSKEKEDTSLQIKNLRSRYSEEQLKVIDEYFDILRWTRKNGRIADSVILKIYQEWERYPIPKVIYALEVYINNPKYHDKRENYCYGIMRNVTADEIAKGEDYGKSKQDNGQDVDQYAGIGLTLEDLQDL